MCSRLVQIESENMSCCFTRHDGHNQIHAKIWWCFFSINIRDVGLSALYSLPFMKFIIYTSLLLHCHLFVNFFLLCENSDCCKTLLLCLIGWLPTSWCHWPHLIPHHFLHIHYGGINVTAVPSTEYTHTHSCFIWEKNFKQIHLFN